MAGISTRQAGVVRKAVLDDVQAIASIIEAFSRKGVMLPRTFDEVLNNIRDFFVCEERGEIVGICALNISWKGLGEIRSLAVKEDFVRMGIGSRLVEACLSEARALGLRKVFALTYKTAFFEKLGFKVVDKMVLPQKIWGDCVKCAKFPSCDETAMLIELS